MECFGQRNNNNNSDHRGNNPDHQGNDDNLWGNDSRRGGSRKRGPNNNVASLQSVRGTQSTKQCKEEFAKLLKKKCPYHPDSKHSMEDCYLLRDTFGSSDSKGKKKSDGDHGDRKGDKGFSDSI